MVTKMSLLQKQASSYRQDEITCIELMGLGNCTERRERENGIDSVNSRHNEAENYVKIASNHVDGK